MTPRHTVTGDMIRAAELWPIWLRMGLNDVRRRFRRSTLGVGWIFLQLAITILALGVIFGALFKQEPEKFLPFLTVGLVIWIYLTSSVVEGGQAFIASEGYVKQIGLPIYVYVFRFFVSISTTTFISFLAYVLIAIVYRVPVGWGTLWALPGILLVCLVSLLLIMSFAYLTTRFRDAGHMASSGLQVMFYVTPVIWPPELLRGRPLAWVIDINPFHHLLQVVRHPLLAAEPADLGNYLTVSALILALVVATRALALRYHRRIVYFL